MAVDVSTVLQVTNAVLPSLMAWVRTRTAEDGQVPTLDQAREFVEKDAKNVLTSISDWKAAHPIPATPTGPKSAPVAATTSTSTTTKSS